MKWLNSCIVRLMVVGVVAAVVLSGRNVKADFTFGEPTNMGPLINGEGVDASPLITPDGLEFYFCSDREGGSGEVDLWMTSRPTKDDEWETAVNLGSTINGPGWDLGPSLSADGLTLYFASDREGGSGGLDIWMASRTTLDDPWGEPVSLGAQINSDSLDCGPSISPDNLTLFFYSDRLGEPPGSEIWMTTRQTVSDSWGPPVQLESPINTEAWWDYWPSLSAGGRVLLFVSDREGGSGGEDIWMAKRPSVSDPWGPVINLGLPINMDTWDTCPYISGDGSMLFFVSDRDGGHGSYDLWQASVAPVVDLNSDGIVDAADMCTIVDSWGTDDSLCDIGPPPFGDGIVNVEDLIVLAEHLFEEIPPAGPTGNIIWVSDQQDFKQDGVPDDQEWVDILEAEGYVVDYTKGASFGHGYWRTLNDDKIAALNAADLIIISYNVVGSASDHANGNEPTQWNSITTPIISNSAVLIRKNRWKWLNTKGVGNSSNAKLDILAPDHPIFEGVTSPVRFTDGNVGLATFANVTGVGVGNGTMLAQLVTPTANEYAAIVEWEPGVEFYDGAGQIAGGPRMLFCAGTFPTYNVGTGTAGTGEMNLRPDGLKIFLNAVKMYIER